MKNYLLTCVLISICTLIYAQEAVVKVSPEYKLKKKEIFEKHLDSDATGHYVYFSELHGGLKFSTTMFMSKYDNEFKEIWSYDYLADKKDVRTYGLQTVNEKFIWLLSEEANKNTIDYYLAPINREGDLGSKVKVNTVKFENRRDQPFVGWAVSEDSTMITVVHTFDRNKEKLDFEYNVAVVDDDLNELWSAQVRLAKSQEQVDVLSSVIGNDAAHYMLVKEYESRNAKESKKKKGRKGKKKVAAYDLKIYKLGEGMSKPEIIELDLNEKFARGASLKVSESGDITCIGMFSNKKKGDINGVYYLKLDSQGQPIASNIKAFSDGDLAFLGDRNTDKDRSGDEGIEGFFSFGEQLTLSDGTVIVSAEENFSRTVTDNRGNSRTTYYSNDIVVITFEPDGAIRSIKLIPKRQKSGFQSFLSHAAMTIDGEGAFFFYNDDKDNMDRDLDKKPKRISSMKDCVTACARVDLDGNITRKAMLKNKDVKALLLPGVCKPVNENTFFFVGMKPKLLGKSNFRIGTIELN